MLIWIASAFLNSGSPQHTLPQEVQCPLNFVEFLFSRNQKYGFKEITLNEVNEKPSGESDIKNFRKFFIFSLRFRGRFNVLR